MRQLTKREIKIRFNKKAEEIKTAYAGSYRNVEYNLREANHGIARWTINIPSIELHGFKGLTYSFKTKYIAMEYARGQIDVVLGKDVRQVIAELF